MSNKTTETFKGQTDTSQMFSNFFDNLTKGSFKQSSTGEQIGKTTGIGTSEMLGTTTGEQKGTSTGTATTENRYEFKGDEDTQDIKDYRAALSKQNEADPSIKYGAAAAIRAARNRYTGVFGMGAGQSAAARQSMFKAEEGGVREQEGQNLIKDAFNRRQQQLGGMATLAGLTKRQLVNVGGTTTSSGTTAGTSSGTTNQTGKTTQDTASNVKSTQDTSGSNESESMGFGGGEQTGHQTEASTRTTSTPMWGQLLGAAAQMGAAGATKGAA